MQFHNQLNSNRGSNIPGNNNISNNSDTSNAISNSMKVTLFIGGLSFFITESALRELLTSLLDIPSQNAHPIPCRKNPSTASSRVASVLLSVEEIELKYKYYVRSGSSHSHEVSGSDAGSHNSIILYARVTFVATLDSAVSVKDVESVDVTDYLIDKISRQRFMGKVLAASTIKDLILEDTLRSNYIATHFSFITNNMQVPINEEFFYDTFRQLAQSGARQVNIVEISLKRYKRKAHNNNNSARASETDEASNADGRSSTPLSQGQGSGEQSGYGFIYVQSLEDEEALLELMRGHRRIDSISYVCQRSNRSVHRSHNSHGHVPRQQQHSGRASSYSNALEQGSMSRSSSGNVIVNGNMHSNNSSDSNLHSQALSMGANSLSYSPLTAPGLDTSNGNSNANSGNTNNVSMSAASAVEYGMYYYYPNMDSNAANVNTNANVSPAYYFNNGFYPVPASPTGVSLNGNLVYPPHNSHPVSNTALLPYCPPPPVAVQPYNNVNVNVSSDGGNGNSPYPYYPYYPANMDQQMAVQTQPANQTLSPRQQQQQQQQQSAPHQILYVQQPDVSMSHFPLTQYNHQTFNQPFHQHVNINQNMNQSVSHGSSNVSSSNPAMQQHQHQQPFYLTHNQSPNQSYNQSHNQSLSRKQNIPSESSSGNGVIGAVYGNGTTHHSNNKNNQLPQRPRRK